jgi:hypothetical protein
MSRWKRRSCWNRPVPALEGLECRIVPAVTASWNDTDNVLIVTGAPGANNEHITITQQGGNLVVTEVNVGTVTIMDGPAPAADTTSIVVNAGDGHDTVDLSGLGAFGGGSGTTTLDGQGGSDQSTGSGQNDKIEGGL